MKTLLKKQVGLLLLVCMPCGFSKATVDSHTVPSSQQTSPSKEGERNQDYTNPTELMRDFLDVTKKPDAKLQYWARQFLLLFQKDPKLKDFCKELAQAVHYKNANRIGTAFIMYQDKFSQELRTQLLSRGLPVVKKALQERVKK